MCMCAEVSIPKAMYDYMVTINEEFDFKAGDIIVVTDTPLDGWWSGELVDETCRQAGQVDNTSFRVTWCQCLAGCCLCLYLPQWGSTQMMVTPSCFTARVHVCLFGAWHVLISQ